MPVADLVLDNPTKEFERYYIKVTDRSTNLVIYSASLDESPRLLRDAGDLPGLYILQAEDSTVYVGQSKALESRLKTHRTSRKIGFIRILAVVRDQSLAQYLDYAEAKIYDELDKRGFRLDQAPLSGSLETKRRRLSAQDDEHVRTADVHVLQFLTYAVALGLVKPQVAPAAQAKALPGPPVVEPLRPAAEAPVAENSPQPSKAGHAPDTKSFTKRKTVKLEVRDAKGNLFEGKHTADIFAAALQYIGFEKLAAMNLKLSGHPLLRRDKPSLYSSETRQLDGFYIATHSSNKEKAKLLVRLSEMFGTGLQIKYIEPLDR